MMNLVEEMVETVAYALHRTTKIQVGENIIDFKRPWKRYTMYEAIEHFTGVDISVMSEEEMVAFAKKVGVEVDNTMGKGKLIDEIFGETCEAQLIQPTFIYDYPIETSPLTKKHRSKPGLTERFEAVCNGKEICNAYSELNDPIDQRQRFEEQLKLANRGDSEAMVLDDAFLSAIELGMPPTAGLGIGIDRLSMIMTNSHSIQDVLFFPQMRPEKKQQTADESIFINMGFPENWAKLLLEAGFNSETQINEMSIGKLHATVCGLNKKFKKAFQNPTPAELESWLKKLNQSSL